MILWSRDKLTKIQTCLPWDIHLYQPVHLWRRWPVTLLPHQLFKNIGNLKILNKLMFIRMITRPSVVGVVLKHLCHLVTDWLVNWVTLLLQIFSWNVERRLTLPYLLCVTCHVGGESVINFATPSSFLMPFQGCKISQILQTCCCEILLLDRIFVLIIDSHLLADQSKPGAALQTLWSIIH